MMEILALFFFDWSAYRPEALIGGQVLERIPAALSLLYLAGIIVVLIILVASFIGQRRLSFRYEEELPPEIRRKLSVSVANRSLRVWHVVFLFLALGTYGFHVYWGYFAEETNEDFQALSYKDLRQRRANAMNLRGWIYDRSGKLSKALAYYKLDKDGSFDRVYPLKEETAHLMGTELGTPGLERSLFVSRADPLSESWQTLTTIRRIGDESVDVRLTIDKDLQDYAAAQLKGRKGAIVVINPQTGEVLASFANPTFNLEEARSPERFLELEANRRDQPLLNRATREYYAPGSTFKLFTMISAFRARRQNETLATDPGGYVPFKGSRPIFDSSGGCSAGCGVLSMDQAFESSSNQFFAQMAVLLGRERLKETAKALGIAAVETPGDTLGLGFNSDIWTASDSRVKKALGLQQAAIVTGSGISAYDIALQGIGQGYAGQMTPFQMALVAAAVGNLDGRLMRPRIEYDLKSEVFAQVVSPQQARDIREIMALVNEGSRGTASGAFGSVRGSGIRSGGKTGTAEKMVPVYDANGRLKTVKKKRRNAAGEIEEYTESLKAERVDSWYISIAPLERPTLAIAVVVEGGGYGGKVAAPIAANIILKARSLGLLGDAYAPTGDSRKGGKR